MIIYRSTIFLPFFLTLTAIFSCINTFGADKRIGREEYIECYKHIAMKHQLEFGIPASITMAQGILESDSGNSTLAKGSNNHFGIKCKSNWTGRTFTHTDDAPDECFRAYSSVEDSYEDHAKFLDESPRYDSLFDFRSDDYRSWARGLKSAGYATAPDYTARLIKIIEDNKLYMLDSKEGAALYAKRRESKEVAGDQESKDINPNGMVISANQYAGYDIRQANNSQYILSAEGDEYATLAATFHISAKRLRRFNDVDKGRETIDEASIVYLQRKSKRWYGEESHHVLRRGETIHSVSQLYGIRVSKLRKLNRVGAGDEVGAGVTLRLK